MTEDKKNELRGFDHIITMLWKEEPVIEIASDPKTFDDKIKGKCKLKWFKPNFAKISTLILAANPDDIIRHDYVVNGKKWFVWESPLWKSVTNECFDYHYFFSKRDGFTCRFGTHVKDDPEWCELGPEIADIEVVAGKCPKINGKNCAFCYKNNGGDVANCMTFDEFKQLLDVMPKNLSQIAFGITGVQTNPDFFKMMEYAKQSGVSPNYTTNGVDLTDELIDKTLDTCGRIAVSCYEGAKDICYNTIKRVGERAALKNMSFPCNIHVVLSKDTFPHVMSVLQDAKDKKIENLGAIVILRIKPVGRAKNLDCSIPHEMYEQIVKFCMDNDIRFGFDSCGAKQVAKVLEVLSKEELMTCVEPCESSRASIYINKDCKMTPCSFCEHLYNEFAIDLKTINGISFTEIWNNNDFLKTFRNICIACKKSCQCYDLDC